MRTIRLRGARTHNLKAIDLDLEPGSLVVVAGPSGSGKSSLAFGTLYAEGQRAYVESFSAYARQFLERMARPPVDELYPVPATIAVDRQAPVKTSRATVATMTELVDYAKSLWAVGAVLHCQGCGRPVHCDTPERATKQILREHPDAKLTVSYPLSIAGPEAFIGVRERLLADGYRRVQINNETRDLEAVRPSELWPNLRAGPESLMVLADRTTATSAGRARLTEALEAAFLRGQGRASVHVQDGTVLRFSQQLHCARCDLVYGAPSPSLFSFNSPVGACADCRGFGRIMEIDWDKVIPDPHKTLAQGAIRAWSGKSATWERRLLMKLAQEKGVPVDVPFGELSKAHHKWIMEGESGGKLRSWKKWFGLKPWFEWLESKAYKMHVRVFIARYRKYVTCLTCAGTRFKAEALLWRLGEKTIADFLSLTVKEAASFLEGLGERDPAQSLLIQQCGARLTTMVNVGLPYLTLDRSLRTLSGGEAQRVALTSALSAELNGSMFVLDEPTVGLHPHNVADLMREVRRLAQGDNIALMVEHDEDVIKSADRVIELGPSGGERGGEVVFDGTPLALWRAETATGAALRAESPTVRPREPVHGWITLKGATGHNLNNIDLRIPVGLFSCVTGVSGSGKTSVILETLFPAVAQRRGQLPGKAPLPYDKLELPAHIQDAVCVDQAPLGRTSRGNPATYMKAWEVIRQRFAAQPLAKERGYGPGFFSFNVAGGRCETCKGEGSETIEMQFLADVSFSCPDCQGSRFVGPVLDVQVGEKTIADVLGMTVDDAVVHFNHRELVRRLAPLCQVGLGYLKLGQPLNTLSGGEAQRLKLAAALGHVGEHAIVILDEPTAGLHARDIKPLLETLQKLVEQGNTVVVVEHDMRVAAQADYVIDLGPGPGDAGGDIVAQGTPRDVAQAGTASSPFLERVLNPVRLPRASVTAPKKQPPSLTGICVEGAREHNLKDLNLEVPREKLVVISGPSGSGKSTLAFDVIYAEGQRRYMETLSPYVRQYLPQLPRPDVHSVRGIPPTVALEQRITRGGVNSTVGTITEVAHYLRLIYARFGLLHCVTCNVPIAANHPDALAKHIRELAGLRQRLTVFAPAVRGKKGLHRELLARAHGQGIRRARIDGTLTDITPGMKLERYVEHDIDLLVAEVGSGHKSLDVELKRGLKWGEGVIEVQSGDRHWVLSSKFACPKCGQGYPELDPRFFSFNTRQGACSACEGRGVIEIEHGKGRNAVLETRTCDTCQGTRLSPLARSVMLDGRPITALLGTTVQRLRHLLPTITLPGRFAALGGPLINELDARLAFLEQVGVGYLGLDRSAQTLSGGETQRVRLAAQLGSALTGVLYVLDEPTIGLHPRDTQRLIVALKRLVEKGCSVLVVEHDADVIRASDHLIDMGPSGGENGGSIVAQGAPARLLRPGNSLTGTALAASPRISAALRSLGDAEWLTLTGAHEHNLKDVDLTLPLGRLIAVTGVSGSGKSSLIRNVLLSSVRHALGLETNAITRCRTLKGTESLRRAVEIDQNPIGRTPRSVPATYIGVWDVIRKLLAGMPEARARGYDASRFSFNTSNGRCTACEGQGALTVEMAFLPDVLLPCESCKGRRFSPETLEIRWQGLSAGEILELDVTQAVDIFSVIPKVAQPLRLLDTLGLGYLKLGQPSNTLSGGEAQRLKLVAELGARQRGGCLYVMDEPTTGLHRTDVMKLIALLERLVDRGDTVVVIEHHTDVMLAADWLIDLGPEGGDQGGQIVFAGTPSALVRDSNSYTAEVLREELDRAPKRKRAVKAMPPLRAEKHGN
ncbi:MAG: excinuclease ABC subunit UvrA [Myxococcales bacterium]|nr:excinuclease ABC subunit UvrA [Myxococcales bacterium]